MELGVLCAHGILGGKGVKAPKLLSDTLGHHQLSSGLSLVPEQDVAKQSSVPSHGGMVFRGEGLHQAKRQRVALVI